LIEHHAELVLALLLCFCLLGFLVFNLRHRWRDRASVFLGDAGSLMLGAILGFLAISLSQQSDGRSLSPVAALWICAVPLIDTASLTLRRLAAGQSPFTSDRRHLHHLMLQAGLTVNEVVAMLVMISAVCGAIGVLGWYVGVPDDVLFLGLVGPIGLHAWFSFHGWRHLHWPRHAMGRAETVIGPAQASLER
jgi:UDP-GlcNAc:undecaprenyl-phosphate GlcNAc-1-phosphate transferase